MQKKPKTTSKQERVQPVSNDSLPDDLSKIRNVKYNPEYKHFLSFTLAENTATQRARESSHEQDLRANMRL